MTLTVQEGELGEPQYILQVPVLDITLQSARHSAGHEFLFRSKRAHRNDGEPIH